MRLLCCSLWFFGLLFVSKSLPKFFQNDWGIKHHILEVEDYNRKWFTDIQVYLFTYNRTVKDKLINGTGYMNMDGRSVGIVDVEVYKFLSNEYRPFPINLAFDMCEEYKKNGFGIRTVKENSNFRGCPAKKGFYYIYNYRVRKELFPPHIPTGKYKLLFKMRSDQNEFLARFVYYGEVVSTKL